MPPTRAEAEQIVRDALAADRTARGISWQAQANEMGVPLKTLHAFVADGKPLGNALKRPIRRIYPQLIPQLVWQSLAWMGDGDEEDDTGPAESGRAPPGLRSS